MTLRVWSAIAVTPAMLIAMLLSSCDTARPESAPGTTAGSQPPAALGQPDLALLDQVTTLETLLPDAADRALYEAGEPAIEDGKRQYTFMLKSQPGMDPSRHFQVITVTWARGGALSASGPGGTAVSGTGGPNGGLVDAIARTADRAYDIRVSQGELLPASAKAAGIMVDTLAQRLTDKYADVTSRK